MFSIISKSQKILTTLQLYASVLALVAVSAPSKIANVANTHLVWVLFGTWIVYSYRDIYPLGTFTLEPLDLHEGRLMWAKLAVLTFAAAVILSFIPTQYVPFDPKVRPHPSVLLGPEPKPAPHRTQPRISTLNKRRPGSRSFSSFSWMTSYSRRLGSHTCSRTNSLRWLTTIGHPIWSKRASRYVSARRIYAACDSDLNDFQHLDPLSPTRKRHMFFGLMKVFRREYTSMCFLLILRVCVPHK